MKIKKMILIALVFAVPVLLNAQEQSTAPAQAKREGERTTEAVNAVKKHEAELKSGVDTRLPWEKKKGLERHKMLSVIHGTHKIDIHPAKQADGIKTGLVIAYGHIIPPPYKVEYVADKLVINGVQVKPSLIRERENDLQIKSAPPANKKEELWKGTKIEDVAQELYVNGLKNKPLEKVQREIIELISKSTDVYENPVWVSEKALRVQLAGSHIQYLMQFSEKPIVVLSPVELKRQSDERTGKAQKSILESVKKQLEKGKTIGFLSNGGEVDHWDPRGDVNEVMGEKGLTKDQRIEKLHDKNFTYDIAVDIVDNYAPSEWQTK